MPKIQQITSRVGAAGGAVLSPLPQGFGQSQARAQEALGRAVSGLGSQLADIKERQDKWDAELQWAEFENKVAADYQKRKESAPAGAEGFTEQTTEMLDSELGQFMESAPESAAARQALQLKATKLKGNYLQDSVNFQSRERARYQVARTEEILTGRQNQVRANPSQLSRVLEDTNSLVDNMIVPDPIKDKLRSGARTRLYDSALDGEVSYFEKEGADPAQVRGFIDAIESGELGFRDNSSPQMYDAALSRLRARESEIGTENRALWTKDLADAITDLETHGKTTLDVSKERAQSIYPDDPELVDRTMQQLEWAQQSYMWRQESRLTSFEEDRALLDSVGEKTAGRGSQYKTQYAQRLANHLANKRKQVLDDPVSYLLTNSASLATDYKEAQQSGDPNLMSEVLAKMDTMQERLGLGPHDRQYMGKGAATQAAKVLMDPNTGAEAKADQLEQLKRTYGAKWPIALRELRANGLEGAMSVAARLDTVADSAVRIRLVNGVLGGGSQELARSLQPSQTAEINSDLKDYMAPFRESLTYAGASGQAIISEELEAARILAYEYATKEGLGEGEAAKRAFDQLLGSRYDFGDGFRAPKGMGDIATAYAARQLDMLKPSDFAPAAVGPESDPALAEFGNENYLRRAAWDNAIHYGRWVNTEDGKGLLLMVPDDTTGTGYSPLHLDNGNRVEIYFDEMQDPAVLGQWMWGGS
jgi:hypothetical protein